MCVSLVQSEASLGEGPGDYDVLDNMGFCDWVDGGSCNKTKRKWWREEREDGDRCDLVLSQYMEFGWCSEYYICETMSITGVMIPFLGYAVSVQSLLAVVRLCRCDCQSDTFFAQHHVCHNSASYASASFERVLWNLSRSLETTIYFNYYDISLRLEWKQSRDSATAKRTRVCSDRSFGQACDHLWWDNVGSGVWYSLIHYLFRMGLWGTTKMD